MIKKKIFLINKVCNKNEINDFLFYINNMVILWIWFLYKGNLNINMRNGLLSKEYVLKYIYI